jgi:hypothetical protein
VAIAGGLPPLRAQAPDTAFDGIEFGDATQGFGRDRRAVGLMDLVELAPDMGPTGRERDRSIGGQPFEPGIAIDLEDTFEPREMGLRPIGPAVRTIEIDRCRRAWPIPRSIVSNVNPQPPGLGAAAARFENRDRRVVGEQLIGDEYVRCETGMQWFQPVRVPSSISVPFVFEWSKDRTTASANKMCIPWTLTN